MDCVPTQMTVADYCADMISQKIVVNNNYQRSDKVWPLVAKGHLIETILKGFPIPKLYVHQKTDLKSKQTLKEIVDGQQRSVAIREFFEDKFALAKGVETSVWKGKKFSTLEPDSQQAFLEYGINIDLFTSATTDEVVEVFRRMNSYTVPLNPEEQRHAGWQGKFKWFVNNTAERLSTLTRTFGIFSEKQLVRMADNKLLTELCDSFIHGIRTTNKKILDSVYSSKNETFPEQAEYEGRIISAFSFISQFPSVKGSVLMKPYIIYSIVQAITHVHKPVQKFESIFKSPKKTKFDSLQVLSNLQLLAAALEEEDHLASLDPFVLACSEKTNTAENRKIRFKWICKALTADLVG